MFTRFTPSMCTSFFRSDARSPRSRMLCAHSVATRARLERWSGVKPSWAQWPRFRCVVQRGVVYATRRPAWSAMFSPATGGRSGMERRLRRSRAGSTSTASNCFTSTSRLQLEGLRIGVCPPVVQCCRSCRTGGPAVFETVGSSRGDHHGRLAAVVHASSAV